MHRTAQFAVLIALCSASCREEYSGARGTAAGPANAQGGGIAGGADIAAAGYDDAASAGAISTEASYLVAGYGSAASATSDPLLGLGGDASGGSAGQGGFGRAGGGIAGEVAWAGNAGAARTDTAAGAFNVLAGATNVAGAAVAAVNIRYAKTKQLIEGFGVSNAWKSAPNNKTAVYDALFSLTKGAGLSILRNRIPFRENPTLDDKFIKKDANGNYIFASNADGSKTYSLNWDGWDLTNTSKLISDIRAAGPDYQVATFMSTPWTPPNNSIARWKLSSAFKTIDYANAPEVGGYLDPNHYADYADVLADYVLGYRAKMGVDLDVLSLQNEPNFQCSYESADWTAEQFCSFLGVLKQEFERKGVFARLPTLQIMAPEYQNVRESLVIPSLQDPIAAPLLGIVGVHQYDFGSSNASTYTVPLLTNALSAGKRIWMTEWSSAAWPTSTDIYDGLLLARLVHMDLTTAGMSAFLYWWSWGPGNSHLVVVSGTSVTLPKRLYTLGQYSRFVRPGWYRVETVTSPVNGVLLSAFKDPTGTQVAVVAINSGSKAVSVPLTIDGARFGELTHYRTSSTENIENIENIASVSGGTAVNLTLAASSVSTLVGPVEP